MRSPNVVTRTPIRISPARGFYQVEERSLIVRAALDDRRPVNLLTAGQVTFSINAQGELIAIEVPIPREQWRIDDAVQPIRIAAGASVHWLDFRTPLAEVALSASRDGRSLRLSWETSEPGDWTQMASTLFGRLHGSRLLALQIDEIEDDLAGQQQAAFLQSHRPARTRD